MNDENTNFETFENEDTDVSAAEQILGDDASNVDETLATEPAVAPTTDEDIVEPAEETEETEPAEEPEERDELAAAAAALGDTSEEDSEAEYRRRLRRYVSELKKLPGDW